MNKHEHRTPAAQQPTNWDEASQRDQQPTTREATHSQRQDDQGAATPTTWAQASQQDGQQ